MPNRKTCSNSGIHHVGLYASDPWASAEFYRRTLGMQLVGGSSAETPLGASAFICSRPEEESHEIALIADPGGRHIAYKMRSLADLRELHERLRREDVPIRFAFFHGVSFALYFADPDGNLVEAYWPTDVACALPYGEPLDLTQTDEALLAMLDTFRTNR